MWLLWAEQAWTAPPRVKLVQNADVPDGSSRLAETRPGTDCPYGAGDSDTAYGRTTTSGGVSCNSTTSAKPNSCFCSRAAGVAPLSASGLLLKNRHRSAAGAFSSRFCSRLPDPAVKCVKSISRLSSQRSTLSQAGQKNRCQYTSNQLKKRWRNLGFPRTVRHLPKPPASAPLPC